MVFTSKYIAFSFYYADIDECATNNGGCSEFADCNNTAGSFTCTCWDGLIGDGVTCTGKLNRT